MGLRQLDELRKHQHDSIGLMVGRRQVAVLLKPGLGKTVCALTAALELGRQLGRRLRGLVATPAQVVKSEVWSLEARAWAHTTKLYVTEISGSPEERELKLMLGSDIDVVSYHNLIWLTDAIGWKKRRYDFVIYDELSKMKHPGTKNFKRMKAFARDIPIRFGLTGSPMGNCWGDLWGEMYTVAGEKPLGPTKEQYLDTYFKQVPRGDGVPAWELRKDGSADEIRRRIRPYAFSVNPKVAGAELPEVLPDPVQLKLPDRVLAKELELKTQLETELDSGTTLWALNQSKLAMSIRQFASGAIYTGETGESQLWEELHDVKLEALRNIIDELQGEPLLVFTWFKHEVARIKKKFPGAEMLTGDAAQVARWNKKQIPILLAHPQGSGHGLNLQFGGSSVCWFTLPWSRELFDQGNGRLARMLQPDKYVTAYLLLAGQIDRRVWSALMRKGDDEASILEATSI
jgi:SNF2 family DNA or RNA helicase